MLKIIDSVLLAAWIVFILLAVIMFRLLVGVFRIFKGCCRFLGEFQVFAGFADNFVFRYWRDARWPDAVGERLGNWIPRFSDQMIASRGFRRCAFLIFFLLGIFYYYPPSHWGPWQLHQAGIASYYCDGFWFKKTASGERFVPLFYTAAHKKLPLGITVKVKNLENGNIVYVKINDRGPFVKGRIIDLSSAAAEKLDIFEAGTAKVAIYTRRKY